MKKVKKADPGTVAILGVLGEVRSDLRELKVVQEKVLRRLNELDKTQRALKDTKELLRKMSEVKNLRDMSKPIGPSKVSLLRLTSLCLISFWMQPRPEGRLLRKAAAVKKAHQSQRCHCHSRPWLT